MPVADNLRNLRRKAGLSQTDLARRLGITQSAYSRLETGSRRPELKLMMEASRVLGASLAEIAGEPAPVRPAPAVSAPSSAPEVVMLPLLGLIPAGPPVEAVPGSDVHPVMAHMAGRGRYALRVTGNSMAPEIKHGDLILVEHLPDARAEDLQGRVCVCRLNGENTLKRVLVNTRRNRTRVELRGDNPSAEAYFVGPDDELVIQGRVLAVLSRTL